MVSRKERLAFCFGMIGKEFKKSACGSDDFPKNFSFKDVAVITLLGEVPMMMSELADELSLTPGTMTTKVDNLIKKKIVERAFDKEDRRKVFIQLAKKGEKICEAIMKGQLEMSGKLLKKLTTEEQEIYVTLTEKLVSK